ncbi:hypothetical protein F5Y08DRAFT_344219 [Xylaria arbuscula]|nr:hypothetical protein F5Y08DRAFT_344219 [Xylaria arbuscula]
MGISYWLHDWHRPPPDEIIEMSGLASEKLGFVEKAKEFVAEEARDANGQLSEGVVEARAHDDENETGCSGGENEDENEKKIVAQAMKKKPAGMGGDGNGS